MRNLHSRLQTSINIVLYTEITTTRESLTGGTIYSAQLVGEGRGKKKKRKSNRCAGGIESEGLLFLLLRLADLLIFPLEGNLFLPALLLPTSFSRNKVEDAVTRSCGCSTKSYGERYINLYTEEKEGQK